MFLSTIGDYMKHLTGFVYFMTLDERFEQPFLVVHIMIINVRLNGVISTHFCNVYI